MSRTFTIKELNEKIDGLIRQYSDGYKEVTANFMARSQEDAEGIRKEFANKIEALEDLKMELNEPAAVVNVNWANKIQESLNIIETNKIIKDGL